MQNTCQQDVQDVWEFAESSLFTLFSTCLGHVFVKFEGENKDF